MRFGFTCLLFVFYLAADCDIHTVQERLEILKKLLANEEEYFSSLLYLDTVSFLLTLKMINIGLISGTFATNMLHINESNLIAIHFN